MLLAGPLRPTWMAVVWFGSQRLGQREIASAQPAIR
jgi:hypothetical protein